MRPLRDYIQIIQDAAVTHDGSIALPNQSISPPDTGTVIACGPNVENPIPNGTRVQWKKNSPLTVVGEHIFIKEGVLICELD